jgi:receptor-interacting serine/threonine-protein kinase 5
LSYAREKEKKLYESLVELTYSKQNEIQKMILESVNEIRERLADDARSLEIPGKPKKSEIYLGIFLFSFFRY